MKGFLGFLLSVLCIILLTSTALILNIFKQRDLVLPRTVIGDLYLGGMTRQQARNIIRERLKQFTNRQFFIGARGQAKTMTFQDIGIIIDEAAILDQIPFGGSVSNIELIMRSLGGRRILAHAEVSPAEIARVINEKFPEIPQTKNAFFKTKGQTLEIVKEQKGLKLKVEPLIAKIESNIAFLEPANLVAVFTEADPTVTAADLALYKEEIVKNFPQDIKLSYEKQKWTANFKKNPQWINIEKTPYDYDGGQRFLLKWDPAHFSSFVNENLSKELEQAPDSVRISQDEKGKIIFDGRADAGRAIEREKLLKAVNIAISDKKNEVEIPLKIVPPKIEIASEDLQNKGIKELLSVGYTRFDGSPVNRKHNIGVGISKFNGVLIAPGEIFSFGKNLGVVDGSTGYKKELVIKPEGTIPEYGGGICQVSSTIYRAAVFAGLPIVERSAHSYAVSYYALVGGHGLDATVYPPAVDLKFANDTQNYILVQSYVEGTSAYFKFYGKSDGRTVEMDGPYISNRQQPPADPVFIPDKNLQPGEKKQVEKAHAGFNALWIRYITTKDGDKKKEEIISRYKATANKFLVGGDQSIAGEAKSVIEGNPFE